MRSSNHVELLEKTLPCQVMLSGYPSALYDERLAGWRSVRETKAVCEPGCYNPTGIKRKAASWGERYAATRTEWEAESE